MHTGEFLTRATIWLALACALVVALQRLTRRSSRATPWFWAGGSIACLAHVLLAFGTFHGWSQAAAYPDTARQTAEVTGWNWGGGIYFNYVFVAAWLADAAWWMVDPQRYACREPAFRRIWHAFFLFMAFNATVVFGQGPVRWAGGAAFLLLGTVEWRAKDRNRIAS